jgi:hypothetical protein
VALYATLTDKLEIMARIETPASFMMCRISNYQNGTCIMKLVISEGNRPQDSRSHKTLIDSLNKPVFISWAD